MPGGRDGCTLRHWTSGQSDGGSLFYEGVGVQFMSFLLYRVTCEFNFNGETLLSHSRSCSWIGYELANKYLNVGTCMPLNCLPPSIYEFEGVEYIFDWLEFTVVKCKCTLSSHLRDGIKCLNAGKRTA